MKKLFQFLSCLPLFFSFFINSLTGQIDSLEYVILNSNFDQLIGKQNFPPPPPMIPNANKEDSVKHEKNLKFYEKSIDDYFKSRKIALLYDSLIAIYKTYLVKIYFERTSKEIDSLVKNSQKVTEKIDFEKFDTTGFWLIRPMSIEINDTTCSIVRIYLSRIEINESETKAGFYYSEICGRNCGYGEFIYLEKLNGVWTIIERINLWIS